MKHVLSAPGLLAALAATSAGAATTHQICVTNYYKVAITTPEVYDILDRATRLLGNQSQTTCRNTSLVRSGTLTSYQNTLPGSLSSRQDFDQFTANGCVKVVERITWCGDGTVLPAGGALGCAPVPGQGLAVIREYPGADATFNVGVEPVTWLHEFGHTLGLPHNVADNLDVMAAGIGTGNNRIDTTECGVYSGAPAAAMAGAIAATPTAGLPQPAQAATEAPGAKVEDFVKQPLIAGFPVDQAKTYAADLPKVEKLLSDPAYTSYRPNIIALLGVIGKPETTLELLKSILLAPFGSKPTTADIYSRLAAPIAVGAIANRYSLPETDFAILKQASDPKYWETLVAKGQGQIEASKTGLPANGPQTGPRQLDDADVKLLVQDLAKQSYRGYALTGSAAVQEKLKQDLQGNAKAGAAVPAPVQKAREAQINEAIKLNEKSRDLGALSTYQRP